MTEQTLVEGAAQARPEPRAGSAWADGGLSIVVGVAATATSYIVARVLGGPLAVDRLEVFAVLTSYSCTFLVVRQRRVNYMVGMVSTAAYAVLFHRQGLYASMVLNLYLTPALIYGWFRWRPDADKRPVTNVTARALPVYLAVTAAFYGGAALVVGALDGQMARWDALILIGSMLAQFLLDNKKLQTWIVWAAVNVVAVYVYAQAGLCLAAAQFALFLINTAYGYRSWKRSMP